MKTSKLIQYPPTGQRDVYFLPTDNTWHHYISQRKTLSLQAMEKSTSKNDNCGSLESYLIITKNSASN